jgi:hypothetical protein
MPLAAKQDTELMAIWKIGQSLWKRNYAEFYSTATTHPWTQQHHKHMVEVLVGMY